MIESIYIFVPLLLEDFLAGIVDLVGLNLANLTIVVSLLAIAYHFKHFKTIGRFLSTGTTWLILTIFIFAVMLGLGWIPTINISKMVSDLSMGVKALLGGLL